eukprot:2133567-Amphidinium_carterae.1
MDCGEPLQQGRLFNVEAARFYTVIYPQHGRTRDMLHMSLKVLTAFQGLLHHERCEYLDVNPRVSSLGCCGCASRPDYGVRQLQAVQVLHD